MKIAIVGSRDYPAMQHVVEYVQALPKDTTVISGGARGVDSIAVMTAHRCGLGVRVEYPDWEGKGKGAGFQRNTVLVELADKVVAFWDGKSRGTKDTMIKAVKAGKPVEVHRPGFKPHPYSWEEFRKAAGTPDDVEP